MILAVSVLAMTGCGEQKDPGTPPSDVVNQDGADNSESEISYDGTPMENAVTIRIGQGQHETCDYHVQQCGRT